MDQFSSLVRVLRRPQITRSNRFFTAGVAEQIGLEGDHDAAEVNLRHVAQGARRMFQDPDSNTPPNETANRPDQKPAAVTQRVVTWRSAVRNNNGSQNQGGSWESDDLSGLLCLFQVDEHVLPYSQ